MELKKAPPPVSDINVTPMVDVMLVVLIIFMVITPMLNKGANIDLVKARNPIVMADADKEDALLISIMRDGKIYFGSDRVDADQLTTVGSAQRTDCLRCRYADPAAPCPAPSWIHRSVNPLRSGRRNLCFEGCFARDAGRRSRPSTGTNRAVGSLRSPDGDCFALRSFEGLRPVDKAAQNIAAGVYTY